MAAGKHRISISLFRRKLEELDCPYIEGVDDSWMEELLYKPGEPRMRLMQWLLGKFDPTINEMLEGQHKMRSRNDSRLQRLLFAAHLIGLCHCDDIALIKGETSHSKQAVFFENLIDMVSHVDAVESKARQRRIPPAISLAEQFESDCRLLDTLCRQEDLSEVFKMRIQLSPPDLVKANKINDNKVPDSKHLAGVANNLSEELQTQTQHLEELQQKWPFRQSDHQEVDKVSKTLELTLSTLSQQVAGFVHCYESEMRPWCSRSQPVLSELGPAFKRVYTLLQKLVHLLGSLELVKKSHESICGETKSRLEEVKASGLCKSIFPSSLDPVKSYTRPVPKITWKTSLIVLPF
ncbi:HAUS augmin-like complex subunit 7 isoform X2 [Nematostella vectensis]|uniref:HAUS augmin-like complex subunit 7 isoform X2 n=1 Tax=Nematostella vectensis TaxID=45351 RepID=UPI002076FD6E|nr:HAUS augmin-like complex subunit 7 isoform X2 [Nematostella vectensis]